MGNHGVCGTLLFDSIATRRWRRFDRPAIGSHEVAPSVTRALDAEPAFVNESVVGGAKHQQIVETRLAAVRPMFDGYCQINSDCATIAS